MPKNRKIQGLLVLFMVLSLVFAPALSAASPGSAPQKILDNELVVTQLDDEGKVDSIQVLNHLRVFGDGAYSVEDSSKFKLSSVRNLYSPDKVVASDNKLNLAVSSGGQEYADVYYLAQIDQGELAKVNLPVRVDLEYYLDGQKVKASDLAGKDGHLKIVCQLENMTGQTQVLEFTDSKGQQVKKEAEVFTPFVVSLSGWEFDNERFSNIQAPGKAGESPEGVAVNVQGVTQVSWSVPLVPPKYPAKQYTVLEADGKNMELPSFKIAVIPIVPQTSEIDNMATVQDSFNQLYGGFDAIQKGIGTPRQDATLLFGLAAVKDGLSQVSGGLGSLSDNLKKIRVGLLNPAFDAESYQTLKGSDANGNTPGVKDAIGLMKKSVDTQLVPALSAQKMVIGAMETAIGTSADGGQTPSASTSLYNDVNFLKNALAGTPGQKVITDAIEPKLQAMGANVKVFRDGGTLVTSGGSMPFPASITAVEMGSKMLSESLGKADAGLTLMVMGLGALDKNGEPVEAMVNGKPASVLYAVEYLQSSIDSKLVAGVTQLQEGAGKIGTGAGEAMEAISSGLQTFESVPVIVSALEENAAQADTFLGKPEGAVGTVAYVFQTPEVNQQGNAMKIGLGAIAVALILLLVIGRPPKQAFDAAAEHA